jgi:uncharacterized protein YjbI with pentapeptide repeats
MSDTYVDVFFRTRMLNRTSSLRRANLARADLRAARLRKVDFTGAILHGADLTGATGITNGQLAEAICDESTRLPPGISCPTAGPTRD